MGADERALWRGIFAKGKQGAAGGKLSLRLLAAAQCTRAQYAESDAPSNENGVASSRVVEHAWE